MVDQDASPADLADAELAGLIAELSDGEDPFDAVAALFRGHLPRDESGKGVADLARAALAEGRGASFIRLGDGEGVVLSLASDDLPALTDESARFVGRRHLGDPEALVGLAPGSSPLLHLYRSAIVHADVVGIPDRYAVPLLLAMASSASRRPLFGTVSVYRYLEAIEPPSVLGSALSAASFFHLEILDHLPDLVADQHVVLVTNHADLGAHVQQRLAARSVRVVSIPVQGSLRSGADGPTGHFPDRFDEVVVELGDVRPGSLVLVAAGILAEPYCEVARQAGAVAIDIGSAMDVWAGVRTRVWGHTDELVEAHRLV